MTFGQVLVIIKKKTLNVKQTGSMYSDIIYNAKNITIKNFKY